MSVPNTIPHRIQKRNEGLLRQRRAANEMKFISQPYEFPDVFNFDEYVYDRAAGVGITVYISDTGANLTNPVRTFSRLNPNDQISSNLGVPARIQHCATSSMALRSRRW